MAKRTEITRKGSFLLPKGFRSPSVDVHMVDTTPEADEPGLRDLTGWANLPPDFAPRVTAHWIETEGNAELHLENGGVVPISISSTTLNEGRWAVVRFHRRAE